MKFTDEDFGISIGVLHTKPNGCGIDGVYISKFDEYWKLNGDNIISLINNDKYKPSDVRLEEIVVKSGKKRLISKYTCTDRVLLDILKRKLVPIFEDKFSEYSFAYRENKGTYEAAKYAASLIEKGNKFVVEIDVKDFFENINLQRLESFIAKSVNDTSAIRLIHEYLYAYTVVDGRRQRKTIVIKVAFFQLCLESIWDMIFKKIREQMLFLYISIVMKSLIFMESGIVLLYKR